jgi:hypothetical protein
MIIWEPGRGPRLMGCGVLLLVSLAIMVLVFVLSGGACAVFVFP